MKSPRPRLSVSRAPRDNAPRSAAKPAAPRHAAPRKPELAPEDRKLLLLNKPYMVLCQFTDEAGRETLKDYIKETRKKNDSGDSTSTQTNDKKDDKTIYLTKPLPDVWPSAWRGYMAAGGFDLLAKTKFPFFPNGPPASLDKLKDVVSTGGLIYSMGLSNAQQGDVIMLPFGPKNSPIKPGLAKLALVIETNLPGETNCEDEENCYVKVLEPDNGKFPDICGTTDTWGEMKARYYYKPGHLPQAAKKAYELIKATSSCEETRISQCEMPSWNTLAIYRIRNDIRKGCEKKDKAIECKKDEEAGGAK